MSSAWPLPKPQWQDDCRGWRGGGVRLEAGGGGGGEDDDDDVAVTAAGDPNTGEEVKLAKEQERLGEACDACCHTSSRLVWQNWGLPHISTRGT